MVAFHSSLRWLGHSFKINHQRGKIQSNNKNKNKKEKEKDEIQEKLGIKGFEFFFFNFTFYLSMLVQEM